MHPQRHGPSNHLCQLGPAPNSTLSWDNLCSHTVTAQATDECGTAKVQSLLWESLHPVKLTMKWSGQKLRPRWQWITTAQTRNGSTVLTLWLAGFFISLTKAIPNLQTAWKTLEWMTESNSYEHALLYNTGTVQWLNWQVPRSSTLVSNHLCCMFDMSLAWLPFFVLCKMELKLLQDVPLKVLNKAWNVVCSISLSSQL